MPPIILPIVPAKAAFENNRFFRCVHVHRIYADIGMIDAVGMLNEWICIDINKKSPYPIREPIPLPYGANPSHFSAGMFKNDMFSLYSDEDCAVRGSKGFLPSTIKLKGIPTVKPYSLGWLSIPTRFLNPASCPSDMNPTTIFSSPVPRRKSLTPD